MPENKQQIFEFRGVDHFYFAEIIRDDEEVYICGDPIHIPIQEVGKNTDSSSEAHYYENKAMIVINSEGPDKLQLTIAPPALDKLAKMTGKSYDPTTGMLVDGPRKNKYYAIMYRTKGTDGGYRYVSRLKGQFNIPEENNKTEDDSTDTTNTQIEYTGIYTEHEFVKGIYDDETQTWSPAGVKGIVVDARYGLADVSNFFASVQTPDSIEVSGGTTVKGIGVVPSTAIVDVDDTLQLRASLIPSGATGTVTWTSSNESYATVDENGLVTGVAEGTATITATCGGYSDTCIVSVSESE